LIKLYVSVNGRDEWSGRLASPNSDGSDGPFATFERARDELRRLKDEGKLRDGAVIYVREGIYVRSSPLVLSFEDSGFDNVPIIYRAYPGESVRVIGGVFVTGWEPVSDPDVLKVLDKRARGNVLQADLSVLGVKDYGDPDSGVQLFYKDKRMVLARYPNEGYMEISDVVVYDRDVRGIKGSTVGRFYYSDDRVGRWLNEKDPWAHGFWFWDWDDQRQRIKSIDPGNRLISMSKPYHRYGYRKGQWFYGYNLLSELDSPGEWYLDREKGILYFWPPEPFREEYPIITVAKNLVVMDDVSNIIFDGFIFEAVREDLFLIKGGRNNRITNCVLRNTGEWAVKIQGGSGHVVSGCHIYNIGNGGIQLNGGDRKTLTPAGHKVENCHIHDYGQWRLTHSPALLLDGVGMVVRHNYIHDAPNQAIIFRGNDHLIEYNEIHDVCRASNDVGVIYSGRDWTWRGNVIRYNFIHHVTGYQDNNAMGVYLDDMLCGTIIYGNVFYKVTRAVFIGGGRDNIVENNIFVECDPAIHVDARALGWASYHVDTTMKERLLAMPYKDRAWRDRYPKLLNILDDEPAAPKGNVIRRNICWKSRCFEIYDLAKPYVKPGENLVDVDPLFFDSEKMNFSLRPESPAFKIGFKPIPFDKIGLVKD